MPTRSTDRHPFRGRRAAPRSLPRRHPVSLLPCSSKNLTPLYSGGLCEAEMTTPRSKRAAPPHAGVGSTPASTAFPPAATTPRANASSSSGRSRGCRGRRKTRPRPDQRVDALPSRSTRSTVRSWPTTPRTPSVPKYRRKPGLSLRELWRLAGLVEAGLLALDDAGVAGEEALALERHPQLRSASTSARAIP